MTMTTSFWTGSSKVMKRGKHTLSQKLWEAIHHYGRHYGACAGTHYEELSLHNYGTQQSFPTDFPLFVAKNYHGARVILKIVRQVGARTTYTRTQNKAYGVIIGISAAVS